MPIKICDPSENKKVHTLSIKLNDLLTMEDCTVLESLSALATTVSVYIDTIEEHTGEDFLEEIIISLKKISERLREQRKK